MSPAIRIFGPGTSPRLHPLPQRQRILRIRPQVPNRGKAPAGQHVLHVGLRGSPAGCAAALGPSQVFVKCTWLFQKPATMNLPEQSKTVAERGAAHCGFSRWRRSCRHEPRPPHPRSAWPPATDRPSRPRAPAPPAEPPGPQQPFRQPEESQAVYAVYSYGYRPTDP